jgi:hypothetical protein
MFGLRVTEYDGLTGWPLLTTSNSGDAMIVQVGKYGEVLGIPGREYWITDCTLKILATL